MNYRPPTTSTEPLLQWWWLTLAASLLLPLILGWIGFFLLPVSAFLFFVISAIRYTRYMGKLKYGLFELVFTMVLIFLSIGLCLRFSNILFGDTNLGVISSAIGAVIWNVLGSSWAINKLSRKSCGTFIKVFYLLAGWLLVPGILALILCYYGTLAYFLGLMNGYSHGDDSKHLYRIAFACSMGVPAIIIQMHELARFRYGIRDRLRKVSRRSSSPTPE